MTRMTGESNARSLYDDAPPAGDPAALAEPWLAEQVALIDLEEGASRGAQPRS